MKKLIFGIALIVLLTGSLAGCARPVHLSAAVNREYNFNGFSRLDFGFTHDIMILGKTVDIPVELDVVQAENYNINLLANQNIFDFIAVSQSGDTLKIRINRNKIATDEATIKFSVSLPELAGLKLNSGILRANVNSPSHDFEADISGASKLNIVLQTGPAEFKVSSSSDAVVSGSASNLKAEVSGASTFKSDLQGTNAIYLVTGSSDVITKGKLQSLAADISGASTLDLDMQVQKADLKMSSSSDIRGKLTAESLKVEASGASEIKIDGSAGEANLRASGSSDIVLPDCVIKNAGIILSGSSEGKLNIIDQLEVDLSGSSDLHYSGNPSVKNLKVSGDSTIDHR
jgi:hypothetical protein